MTISGITLVPLSDAKLLEIGFDVHGYNFQGCKGLASFQTSKVKSMRVLAVVYYSPIHTSSFVSNRSPCSKNYISIVKCLKVPEKIARAQQAIMKHLKHPYSAIHVRPRGDDCLDLWKDATGRSPVYYTSQACQGPKDLHKRVYDAVKSLPKSHTVYVITDPSIERAVFQLLGGLVKTRSILSFVKLAAKDSFLRELEAEVSFRAEIEVAIQADTFLGGHSSNSDLIIHQRLIIRGDKNSRTYTQES